MPPLIFLGGQQVPKKVGGETNERRRRINKKKEQERAKKQWQWQREHKAIKDSQRKGSDIKRSLRARGCMLPFYDFLDSYSDEFQRIVAAAKAQYPSLLGVHEVDDATFYNSHESGSELGYANLQHVSFDTDEDVPDYGAEDLTANMCGSMSAFYDADKKIRSVILIHQSVKTSLQHRDLKYVLKVASLVHEIGHVRDLGTLTKPVSS